jgi:hypothetical protein
MRSLKPRGSKTLGIFMPGLRAPKGVTRKIVVGLAPIFDPVIVAQSKKSHKAKSNWAHIIGEWVQVPSEFWADPEDVGSRPMTPEQCTQQGAWA